MEGFILNFRNKYSIDVSSDKSSEDFKPIAAGINSVEPNFEDEVDDSTYYDGEGFSNEDVTGITASLTFSGHRKYGDEAQDYVTSLAFKLGEDRKTKLKWEQPDGKTITGIVTISEIISTGGEANEKGEFGFTATFNGRPEVTANGSP